MSAEEFVLALSGLGVRLRRDAGGSRGGRRYAKEVVRRRRRWFMRVRGLTSLPQLEFGSLALSGLLQNVDPEKLRIVIPLQPDAEGLSSSFARPRRRRKEMRRLLFDASREGMEMFDLVGARKLHRRLPPLARARAGASTASRSLYLEALGIAIMPDLTDAEVTALEEAGALVLENEKILVDDPEKGAAIKAASTSPRHLAAISVASARELGLTGKGVIIGILDSGIDPDHSEFEGKNIQFAAFKVGGERQKVSARDYGNHGTHVAALAAGRNVGVAPDADLAVAAVLTKRGENGRMIGYRTQIVAGLNWLADGDDFPNAIDVLNASLGSRNDPLGYHTAVSARRNSGLLTVAAIGNDGENGVGNHLAPGKLDCVVAVGAVDDDGVVAAFSDWGQCFATPVASPDFKPDIMAPGVDVESALPKNRYGRSSGTSMASPIVAGACALLIEQDETLRRSPDRLAERVLNLCSPLPAQPTGYDTRRGGRGRLNLANLAV